MRFRLSLLFSSAKKTIDGSGRRVKGKQQQLNSSLMLSLGAVALKVIGGGGTNAIGREEVSMATLEAGTTQKRPLTGTVTLNKFRLDTYVREYLPEKILTKPPGREGGEGAGIHNDSQEGKKMIRYDQQTRLQCNATLAKEHTRSPAIPQGPPRRSRTGVGKDCWPTRFSLTLPK